ncbi:MAG: hypothetical protein KC478_03320 [Bacteriovoracaceae bacterium]|nr:hypothetical protein [Bacteriovoracaceae bacterium]
MATESVEEFLARGGKIHKSNEEISLEKLLYQEGLLDHGDVEKIKGDLNETVDNALKSHFSKDNKK